METTFVYRDYQLICRPFKLGIGSYEARVVIAAMHPITTAAQRFLDLEAFETEEAAVRRARQAGIEWVDDKLKSV
jgi:hypothetical protein